MQLSVSESMALFESVGMGEPTPPSAGRQPNEASRGQERHVSKVERKRRGHGNRVATHEDSDADVVDSESRNAGSVEAGAATIGSNVSTGRRSSTSSGGNASTSGPIETAAINLSCRLCHEEAGGGLDEPLFRCPCLCADAFVHRSCLEELLYLPGPEGGPAACPACGAHYPLRRRTKPLWRWFWEDETREDATLFLANLVFSVGNVGVLTMAWLYALFEYHPESQLSQASLALALFVLSALWVAFGCVRFCVLSVSLVQWRRANTTLQALFADKSVAQA